MNLTIDPDGYIIFQFKTKADLAAFCRRIPNDVPKVLNQEYRTLTIKHLDLKNCLTIDLVDSRWKVNSLDYWT